MAKEKITTNITKEEKIKNYKQTLIKLAALIAVIFCSIGFLISLAIFYKPKEKKEIFLHNTIDFESQGYYKLQLKMEKLEKNVWIDFNRYHHNISYLDFTISINNLMPSNYSATRVCIDDFDLYLTNFGTIYEMYIYEDKYESKRNWIEIPVNKITILHLRVHCDISIYKNIQENYILKLWGTRI